MGQRETARRVIFRIASRRFISRNPIASPALPPSPLLSHLPPGRGVLEAGGPSLLGPLISHNLLYSWTRRGVSVLLDPYTEWTWFTRTALSVCREPLPSSKDRPSVPFTLVCIYPLRTGSMPPLPGVARTDPVYPVETGYLEATEDTYMQCFIAGEPVVKVLQDTRYLPLGSYRYYLVVTLPYS